MSVKERLRRYKTTGGGVGLVRVEVLVSAEDRDAVLSLAADLRARRRARQQPAFSPLRSINREMVNDRAKLILHRLIARHLRRDPDLLDDARTRLAACSGTLPDYVLAWREILARPVDQVAREIIARSERMTRLRTASPFRLPAGFDDPDWRRRVWRKARLGVNQ